MPLPRVLFCALSLTLTVGACADEEDEVQPLFGEDGTWSLQEYSDDGEGFTNLSGTNDRKDAFLLHYSKDKGALAAAMCSSTVTDDDFSPASSQCRMGDADRKWRCQCFSYYWEANNNQRWLEYDPKGGKKPPNPTTAPPEKTTDVTMIESGTNTYTFSPLPGSLFDSDGVSSMYVFLSKADSLIEESECIDHCF